MTAKIYSLRDAQNREYASETPGQFGGDRSNKLYGRLDCASATKAVTTGDAYARRRVFFAEEAIAIAAGYRPCSRCMPTEYRNWKAAQTAS